MEKSEKKYSVVGELVGFSKTIVAIVSVLSGGWFLFQPVVDDYIDEHINTYDETRKKEWSTKEKFRDLLSNKMGCAPDEVHIELGRMYKNEPEKWKEVQQNFDEVWNIIDSDFRKNKEQRNKIIQEIKTLIPESTLKIEQ